MTSLHRLIVIVIIWLVVAFLGAIMPNLALFVPSLMVTVLYGTLLAAAAASTWAVTRAS
jgi:hypothetical protein